MSIRRHLMVGATAAAGALLVGCTGGGGDTTSPAPGASASTGADSNALACGQILRSDEDVKPYLAVGEPGAAFAPEGYFDRDYEYFVPVTITNPTSGACAIHARYLVVDSVLETGADTSIQVILLPGQSIETQRIALNRDYALTGDGPEDGPANPLDIDLGELITDPFASDYYDADYTLSDVTGERPDRHLKLTVTKRGLGPGAPAGAKPATGEILAVQGYDASGALVTGVTLHIAPIADGTTTVFEIPLEPNSSFSQRTQKNLAHRYTSEVWRYGDDLDKVVRYEVLGMEPAFAAAD